MKKKLLFFLLTVVCTLLCAPPEAVAWNLGSGFEVKLRGEGFKYADGTSPSWGDDAKAMTWNSTNNRYEATITATSSTINFKFYWDNGQRSPYNQPSGISTSLSDLKWSEEFYGDWAQAGHEAKYSVTTGDKYTIFLMNGNTNPKYAIYKVPDDTPAWNFSGNTIPKAIRVNFDLHWINNNVKLDYDSANKLWYADFTPTSTSNSNGDGYVNFWIEVSADGSKYYQYGEDKGKTSVNSGWTENALVKDKHFYQGGLTANKKYRIQLKNVTGNNNHFQWQIIEAPAIEKVATPTFSPAAGAVTSGTKVTISCGTSGATIYYTLDNSDPATSSTKQTYSSSNQPTITAGCTLKAVAVKSGMDNSEVASAAYTINVGGWDFSGNTKPAKITIQDSNNDTFTNFDLVYNPATQRWTGDFTPGSKLSSDHSNYINFTIKADNETFYSNKGTNSPNVWVTNAKAQDSNQDYYQGGLTADKTYTFELRANSSDHSNFDWCVYEKKTVYTVSVDLSKMGAGKWNPSNVKAYFWEHVNNAAYEKWGEETLTGEVKGDVVTFSFSWDKTPTRVIFKTEANGQGAKKTTDLVFTNGKNYVLRGQVSSSGDDNLNWKETPSFAVNLPYGPNDFKPGESKYFLVGPRMGMWRLQPEWELIKQADGTYKTSGGRYMFLGSFAVAKVDSYDKYTKHQYTILANPSNSGGIVNESKTTITGLANKGEKTEMNPTYGNANQSSDKVMKFNYGMPSTTHEWDWAKNDKGVWCESIELNSNANAITFKVGADTQMASQRVFTLVGGNIKHNEYGSANDTYGCATPRSNKEGSHQDGWQDAWIQYDANGKPYMDANKEYLYHTAYVPEILNNTNVQFQIEIPNEPDFSYTSNQVTFVEKDKLNLSQDKYSDLYQYFIDHPEAVNSNAEIKGGKDEKAFNFKFGTIDYPEGITSYNKDNAQWQVYVIQGAWLKGQFKIWNGWGGNSINNEGLGSYGDDDKAARWNRLSGGPAGTSAVEVNLTDVNAGNTAQSLNKVNVDQGAGGNWKTKDEELKYYNSIVLLYNTKQTDRMANSYVLFLQDETQPVIKAYLEGNNENNGYYTWHIENIVAGTTAKITGYTVTRYLNTTDGLINPVRIETYTKPALNVSGFEARTFHENTKSGWTAADYTLTPGSYIYRLVVTLDDGTERTATSNPIRVYGDGIYPDVRVEQLVELKNLGYLNLGLGTTDFEEGKYYLTYRGGEPSADYYVVKSAASGNVRDIEYIKQVDSQKAVEVLSDPRYYIWCARFYVRALDFTAFEREIAREGLVYENVNLSLIDNAAMEAKILGWNPGDYNYTSIATKAYDVELLSGAKNTYMGAVIDRNGLLYGGDMTAQLTYMVGEGTASENVPANVAKATFTPVVAQPYDLMAKYVYRTETFDNPVKNHIKDNMGKTLSGDFVAHIKVKTSTSHQDHLQKIDVLVPESAVPEERHLDCEISFKRPNVSQNILNLYDIYYTIDLETVEEDGLTEYDKINYTPTTLHKVYYDATEDASSITPYKVIVRDVHPSDKIYPKFEISNVQYRRNGSKRYYLNANHSYESLSKTFPNSPQRETTVTGIGLGHNPEYGADGKPVAGRARWFIAAHKEVDANVSPDGTAVGDLKTNLYLVEISDATQHTYAEKLWHHNHAGAQQDADGYWWEPGNNPFYIGTLDEVTKTDPTDATNKIVEAPAVTITPVTFFHRDPASEGVTGTDVIDLTEEGKTPTSVKRRAAATTPKFTVEDKYITLLDANGAVLDHNVTDPVYAAVYDATANPNIVVAKNVSSTISGDSKAPVMTGIEDVEADGNAEAVYYNLQGIRVANPEHGNIYIRVKGKTSEKVVF